VTLNNKEQNRLIVLSWVEWSTMTHREAVRLLNLSLRQVKRILEAYTKKDAAALAHVIRGESPGIPWMRR
jgi:transposase